MTRRCGRVGDRLAGVLVLLSCMGVGVATRAAAQEPPATLQPSQIALDEAAELRLSADDGTAGPPRVPGLEFQPTGQSSEMTSLNGAVSQHTWLLYRVSARQPGTYRIRVGGQLLSLTVMPAGASANAGGMVPQRSTASAASQSDADRPIAFLRTQAPHGRLYVGQAIPIAIKAYFRPGTEVTIAAAPSLGDPTFTVSDLSENPVQSTQIVGGREYGVATWSAIISGTMPGSFSTEVTLPVVARYREVDRRGASGNDPFADDPMMSSMSSMMKSMLGSGFAGGFGGGFTGFANPFGTVRERELTLHSLPTPLTLLPLPTEERPAGFSGAVGHFSVKAQLTPLTGTAFEPISLQFEVSGQGNFDRVAFSGLDSAGAFKTYPSSSSFSPGSRGSSFTGTKTFTQPVVPQRAGTLELPPIAFSAFDPQSGRYVTQTTTPLRVVVAQGAVGASPSPTATVASKPMAVPEGLRPDHAPTPALATLDLPQRSPWCWVALGLPILGLGFALWMGQRRRRGPSTRQRRQEWKAASAANRRELHEAVRARDVARFFEAARTVVQSELGKLWSLSPEQVTASELRSRLGEGATALTDTLQLADAVRYGARRVDPSFLAAFDSALEKSLNQAEVVS